MSFETETQPDVGTTPDNGVLNELPQNEGETVDTTPQVDTVQQPKVEKTYTQKDLDNIAAKARGTAERETTKRIMQQLGMSSYDEDMLYAMREAYENSLTDAELREQEYNDLSDENLNLIVELDEKDYMIEALTAMSGKKRDDVMKIVKMAQGLKTEENSIADCIQEVMGMINSQPQQQRASVPVGQPLNQPSSSVTIDAATNPFRAGSINLTAQGRLWKENPELARRLAGEAGIKLNF